MLCFRGRRIRWCERGLRRSYVRSQVLIKSTALPGIIRFQGNLGVEKPRRILVLSLEGWLRNQLRKVGVPKEPILMHVILFYILCSVNQVWGLGGEESGCWDSLVDRLSAGFVAQIGSNSPFNLFQ